MALYRPLEACGTVTRPLHLKSSSFEEHFELLTALMKDCGKKKLSELSIKESNNLITKYKENPVVLGCLYRNSKKTLYCLAKDHEDVFIKVLTNTMYNLGVPKKESLDTLPEAKKETKIERIQEIAESLKSTGKLKLTEAVKNSRELDGFRDQENPDSPKLIDVELIEKGIRSFVNNVSKREPIAGLPQKDQYPQDFEKAYKIIENRLKIATEVVDELYKKYLEAKDEANKTALKDLLDYYVTELATIGFYCGTRYMQGLENLYYGMSLNLPVELSCVNDWKKTPIKVPEIAVSAEPRLPILDHLSSVLYELKKRGLTAVFSKTRRSDDAHHESGFWEHVQDSFGIVVRTKDPLAVKFYLRIRDIKGLYKKEVKAEEIVKVVGSKISIDGGDTNPYINLLSQFCGTDQDFKTQDLYEYDDDYIPTGLKPGAVALILQQVGVLK